MFVAEESEDNRETGVQRSRLRGPYDPETGTLIDFDFDPTCFDRDEEPAAGATLPLAAVSQGGATVSRGYPAELSKAAREKKRSSAGTQMLSTRTSTRMAIAASLASVPVSAGSGYATGDDFGSDSDSSVVEFYDPTSFVVEKKKRPSPRLNRPANRLYDSDDDNNNNDDDDEDAAKHR